MEETVIFTDEQTGEETEFYIVEEVRINNINYILVADSEEEEATAYILKEISTSEEGEAFLEMVSDDDELDYIGKVFEQVLDDVDFTKE